MKKHLLLGAVVALGLASCEVEEPSLEGKWMVDSQTVFGLTVEGGGSYLQFDGCSSECTGVDYDAGDRDSGTFTYEMNEDKTSLKIVDESNEGGNWNGTWEVLTFTDSELSLTANSIFGPVSFTLKR